MSITNRHEGFTLLEVIISLGISMSLLLIIIKVNSEVINDYCSNSKESILEDNFDNAMLNLDNIINGYEVSDIKAENNQIIIKYDLDFEKDYFTVNHVALEDDNKDAEEKIYFRDSTKSKKGCRTLPIFPEIKQEILNKIERIEKCQKFYSNAYNHDYDGYLFVQDNGNFIAPNYFTKRFNKVITRNSLKKITPHGLRHSIATLLHLEGVDIRDLQDWLGHQSVSSTNRYTRSDYQKQLETGKAIEKIFGNDREDEIKNII